MKDPLIYKLLALAQVLIWTSFLFRYVRLLIRSGTLHRPHLRDWKVLVNGRSILAKFAGAVLMLGLAMVFYGLATVLRQFLGLDYWGRDAVRIVSSVLILTAAAVFHLVLTREKRAPVRENRRATDLP